MKNNFEGVLKGLEINFTKLTKEGIKILIEKNVVKFKSELSDDDKFYWKQVKPIIRSHFGFEGKFYELNDVIYNEIYTSIKKLIELPNTIKSSVETLHFELKKTLDRDLWANIIRESYKIEYKNFENRFTLEDDEYELRFEGLCLEKTKSKDWVNYINRQIMCSPITIYIYLVGGINNKDELNLIENIIDEEESFNYINYWRYWFQLERYGSYCEKLISKHQLNIENKDIYIPSPNLYNVIHNINRFPKVFKNAYNCEFHIYLVCKSIDMKPTDFSYYFDILKRDGFFIPKIAIKDYLNFINNVFQLNEKRIRKELANRVHAKIIKHIIKLKVEFDNEIASINNS